MRNLLIIIFSFFAFTSVEAQKLKQVLADGDKAMNNNNYFEAAIYYNQAILLDSTDINIQYKYYKI